MTYLLIVSSKLHQELVIVKHLKGFLNDLNLLQVWVWNDVRVGWLDVVEDRIASSSAQSDSKVALSCGSVVGSGGAVCRHLCCMD